MNNRKPLIAKSEKHILETFSFHATMCQTNIHFVTMGQMNTNCVRNKLGIFAPELCIYDLHN